MLGVAIHISSVSDVSLDPRSSLNGNLEASINRRNRDVCALTEIILFNYNCYSPIAHTTEFSVLDILTRYRHRRQRSVTGMRICLAIGDDVTVDMCMNSRESVNRCCFNGLIIY